MPSDTVRKTKPVLVHLDPEDWAEFQRMAGRRKASLRLRRIIRETLDKTRPAGK